MLGVGDIPVRRYYRGKLSIIEQVLAVGDYCAMCIIVQCACAVDHMQEARRWLAVRGQRFWFVAVSLL